MANSKPIKGIRIRDEDIQFLQALGVCGVLDTTEAAYHYPELKINSVQNRLRLLAGQRIIRATKLLVSFDRPGLNQRGGRIPTLYSLTPAGADLVESMTGVRPKRFLNSDPAPATFLHRQDVSRVLNTFTRSAVNAGLPAPDWILEQDVWTNGPKKLPPNQRKLLYHRIDTPDGAVTCHPDMACRLKLPTTEVALFFEVDRSTEGHKQLTNSTRLDAYLLLFQTKGYTRYWPDLKTQYEFIMWVCPSEERIANLCQTFSTHAVASRLRFALQKPFNERTEVVSAPIWQRIEGERRPIHSPS
jgi:hypothetical protein